MKKVIFTGAGVAIVTPMNEDSSINYPKLGELIDWQLERGIDCIVICGTTGESSCFTDEEHVEAIRYAVEHVAGRVPVIAGAGSNDTAYACWLSKEAEKAGADALLQVTPYYNKTSQRGLVKHFNTIADSSSLPVVLYNVPSRTGVNIQPKTYLELSKHPNINSIKEANGDIASIARVRELCGDELNFYAGNDDYIVPVMALGGKGVISVLGNIMPLEIPNICQLMLEGELEAASKEQIRLIPMVDAMFSDVNPIPVKEALNLMGWNVGEPRLPLVTMSNEGREKLASAMKRFGLI